MRKLMVVAVLLVLFTAGCSSDGDDQVVDTPDETTDVQDDPSVGMANPASVHCDEQGGTTEIRDGEGGQSGYCIFEDGSECEEWAYFREECAPGDNPAA